MRATIIPMVAIPVSLIGTFAVLLALGFSANTVSLLAMVLGIGIVVDDAIVVVENVERVMAEEPELHAARGDQEGDAADHRAGDRDLAGAAVGVRAGRLHSRRVRHAVPPVRRHHQRGDADLGDQRADPVAGVVRACSCATTGRPRGPIGWVLRGIDRVRNGYAAVVHRLLRVSVLSVVVVVACGVGIWLHAHDTPTGLPAGGGPGRVLHRRAAAGRRVGVAHARGGASRSRA